MYFDNSHIDDYFRRNLKDYSLSPGGGVWEGIEAGLAKEARLMQRKTLIKVAASLILIAALSVLLYFEAGDYYLEKTSAMSWDQELESSVDAYPGVNSGSGQLVFAGKIVNNHLVHPEVNIPRSVLFDKDTKKLEELATENFANDKLTVVPSDSIGQSPGFTVHEPQHELMGNNIPDNTKSTISNFEQSIQYSATTKLHEKSRLSLSGSFSPVLSYRSAKGNTAEAQAPDESSLLAFSGGMDVGYSLSKNFVLRTGVHYSQIGQSLNNVDIKNDSYVRSGDKTIVNISSTMGKGEVAYEAVASKRQSLEMPKYITSGKSQSAEFTIEPTLYQKFEMVKLPLLLEYTLWDKRFNLSMIGGLNANVLVNEGIFMEHPEKTKKIGTTQGLRDVSYSGTLGLGLKYKVGNQAQLFMEPRLDYYITSLTKDHSAQTFPFFVGLFSGVSISF